MLLKSGTHGLFPTFCLPTTGNQNISNCSKLVLVISIQQYWKESHSTSSTNNIYNVIQHKYTHKCNQQDHCRCTVSNFPNIPCQNVYIVVSKGGVSHLKFFVIHALIGHTSTKQIPDPRMLVYRYLQWLFGVLVSFPWAPLPLCPWLLA